MPQMANITVKAADGSTDVNYTAKVPSAGDKSPAIWKNDSVGNVLAAKPTLSVQSSSNGNRSSRRVKSKFTWPKQRVDAAGNTLVQGGAILEVSALVPQDMTSAEIDEFVAQGLNLGASELFKSMVRDGYSAV